MKSFTQWNRLLTLLVKMMRLYNQHSISIPGTGIKQGWPWLLFRGNMLPFKKVTLVRRLIKEPVLMSKVKINAQESLDEELRKIFEGLEISTEDILKGNFEALWQRLPLKEVQSNISKN